MDILNIIHRALHRTFNRYALIEANSSFNPRMVQRPLIDAGNTGRYALDAHQIAFNSPAGGGTLAPNAPRHDGVYIDVTAQQAVTLAGFGTIPLVPASQGLVRGFRDGEPL